MIFDLADVLPFLKSVARHIETGFSVSVARELAADIAQLSVDDERVWNYGVVFNGAEMSLRVTAFMDDVDAPDVALIVPARLIEMIEAEMKAFFRGAG